MSKNNRLLLAAALFLAFGLRVGGLGFGLPYEFHPDEHQYVDAVLRWYAEDTFALSYINPPLFTYTLMLTFWGWLSFTDITPESIPVIYTFARFHSVAFGVLSVALIYVLTKRLAGDSLAGLLAAWLLAGAFLPVREAHFAVNDTAVAFFVLLALYLSVGLLKRGEIWRYAQVGAAVGLATAAKLTGGVVALAMVGAHLLARPRMHRLLLVGAASAGLTFTVISLHVVLNLPEFVSAVREIVAFGSEGYKGIQMAPASGWQFYGAVFGWGLGWPLVGVVAVGLLWTVLRGGRAAWMVAGVPLVLCAYMGSQQTVAARYILPALAPLLALGAAGLAEFVTVRRGWVWSLIVVGLLAQPVALAVRFNMLLGLPDTRELATEWLIDTIDADTVIVQESYATFPDIYFFEQRWPYPIIRLDERGPHRNAADFYLRHKTDYIVRSQFTAGRIRSDAGAELARQTQAAQLREQAELVQRFNPYAGEYDGWFYLDKLFGPAGDTWQRIGPGPIIEIYALPYKNQPRQYEIPAMAHPVNANFDDKLVLLGYDLPERRAEAGGSLPVTLYWQAANRMDSIYVMFTRLLDSEQRAWGGYDRWPLETAKTTLWHPGEVVADSFSLPINADAPDGIYTIDVGLYAQDDPNAVSLPLVGSEQRSVRTIPVKVGGPPAEAILSKAEPQHPVDIALGQPPAIALRGYDVTRTAEAVMLTLYWASLAQTAVDWSIFAHLRDADNQTVAQGDTRAGGDYPSSLWDAGDLIRATVTIPFAEQSGDFRLVVGLYNLADGSRLVSEAVPDGEIVLSAW